jgi:DNA-binding CsgD family transcriptional regulator
MNYSMRYCYPLSEREEEILKLIVEGRSEQEIASPLYITVGTVKVHRRNIIDKLEFVTQATMLREDGSQRAGRDKRIFYPGPQRDKRKFRGDLDASSKVPRRPPRSFCYGLETTLT